jgi:hypothetical protein
LEEKEIFCKTHVQFHLNKLYKHGLQQKEPYWNFGYPIFTSMFPSLRTGLMYLVAPENVGKSMLQINLALGALLADNSVYWLDFSLDDTLEDRKAYLLARFGGIPINLVKQTMDASDEELAKREASFKHFGENYSERYRDYGISSLLDDDDLRITAETVSDIVASARKQIGPKNKLVVTIDSFHDLAIGEKVYDDNEKLARKSAILKASSTVSDCLYILTAHSRKGSRGRDITLDSLKGTVDTGYDAKVALHIYSDVHANYGNASVFWHDIANPTKKLPVHEVRIIKNKAGSARTVLFFNYLPDNCIDFEVDEEQQKLYREFVFSKGNE